MASTKIIKSKNFFEQEIIEDIAEVPVQPDKSWPDNDQLKIVGKPISRIDGYEKVSGTARYTFDRALPNMAFARTLRSPHPHAQILRIDTSKAKALPGVLEVITYQNTPKISWSRENYLFERQLRYVGDEIACVAAESEQIANEALKLIEVDYKVLDFVTDAAEAMKDDAPKLYEGGNLMGGKASVHERGDVEAGFQEADVIVEQTYRTPVEVHNPLEVHGSLVNWDGDQLTIWDSTQAVFGVRDKIADKLGIPSSQVRVIKEYMGGGFGSKLTAGKYTMMAALLSKKIGRPVKIMLDRKELNLAVGNRPDSLQKLKFGAKKDGTLTAMDHYSYGASGASSSSARCSWPLRTIYQCPNVKTEEYSVYINAGAGRPFRAPGHVQGVFAMDSAMDELAEKLQMDPLDFRLKNYADKDQVYNIPYTSKKLKEAYLTGAKAIGWKNRNQKAGSANGPKKRGLGMASQIWWGGGGPPAYANLKLNRDGSVQVLSGTQDLGTGTYTIIAQVAAEVLQLPIKKIHVTLGDTKVTPYAPSSGGSTTAPSVSPAVRDAAEQMKQKLIDGAAAILGKNNSELKYEKGTVFVQNDPDQKLKNQEIVRKMRESVLVTTGRREANPEGYMINSFGAQFVEVEVDTMTGVVKVLRVVAAHDIGRTLNRKLLENQFHGGIMQGIGFALMEERIIDHNTGKVLTTNLHDYKIPTIGDAPEIEVIIVSEQDPLNSSTGVKGIGEPAMIPTPGAIANAVYNAIGVRIYDLPITPEKVLNALNA